MTRPAWSHSSRQSALTVTSAETKGKRRLVKRTGAVDVSRPGGFRHRSVCGGAVRVNESVSLGMASGSTLSAEKVYLITGLRGCISATGIEKVASEKEFDCDSEYEVCLVQAADRNWVVEVLRKVVVVTA